MSNPQEWFYLEGQDRKGPFDHPTMLQLLQAGVIRPGTWVAREGDTDWKAAATALDSSPTSKSNPASHTSTTPRNGNADSLIGDIRLMLWAGVPLLVFFLCGMVFWKEICAWRYPDGQLDVRELSRNLVSAIHDLTPTSPFDQILELKNSLGMFAICLIPAVLLCGLHRFRSCFRAQKIRVPIWTTVVLTLAWILVIVGCVTVSFYSTTPRAFVLLYILKLYGVGSGSKLFLFLVVLVSVLAGAVLALIKSRRSLVTARLERKAAPLAPLIAIGWTNVTIILLILAISLPVIIRFVKPNYQNPDAITINCLREVITEYQQKTGGRMAAEWRDAARLDGGDIGGYIEGSMVQSLGFDKKIRQLPGGEVLTQEAIHNGTVVDAWNKLPIFVLLDANGDRTLDFGVRKLSGQAAIWSVGWNGRNDNGAGDDLMVVLNDLPFSMGAAEIANNVSPAPDKATTDAPVASLDVSTPEQQVETLIRAISTYQQKHGGTLARDWGSLVPTHARRDYGGGDNYDPYGPTDANPHPLSAQGENICNRSNDGDLDGPVRGKLLELLTGDKSDLASQAIIELNVDGFFVLLDGNADGNVSLLDIPINARALAWSSGPNGINESGAGDDIVRLLK